MKRQTTTAIINLAIGSIFSAAVIGTVTFVKGVSDANDAPECTTYNSSAKLVPATKEEFGALQKQTSTTDTGDGSKRQQPDCYRMRLTLS